MALWRRQAAAQYSRRLKRASEASLGHWSWILRRRQFLLVALPTGVCQTPRLHEYQSVFKALIYVEAMRKSGFSYSNMYHLG